MNDWTASQIKEITRTEIESERRLRDALRTEDRRWHERELKTVAKALELQAKEYERRLLDLNHAHAEARHTLGTYLPRELYERAHTEVVEWQRRADIKAVEIDNRIKGLESGLVSLPGGVKSLEIGLATQAGERHGTNSTKATAITIGAVIIALVSAVIGVISYMTRQ